MVEGQTIRLLGISGSLRRWSTNTALLRAMVAAVPPGVVLEIFDGLSMLPIFNPDCLEGRIPAVVAKWEEKVRQSSGVIIASPEYAHGIPGGLKNALDWLVAGDAAPSKPAMLVHASPRSHISREALREVLKTMSFAVHDCRELEIPLLGKSRDAIGPTLCDTSVRERLTQSIEDFRLFIGSRSDDPDQPAHSIHRP